MTDTELREKTKSNSANGAYAVWICRYCGHFGTDPEGNVLTAELRNVCGHCALAQVRILKASLAHIKYDAVTLAGARSIADEVLVHLGREDR